MIDDAAGRTAARTVSRSRPGSRADAGARSISLVAGLFALFLGLPVIALVARAILDGSLATAFASPVVLDGLWLSLVTTAVSLVITVAFAALITNAWHSTWAINRR